MILRPLYMSSEGTEEGEDCWLQKGCCMLIVPLLSRGEHSTSLPGQLGARCLVQNPVEEDGGGVTG